tara:strand:+ start:1710 stop:1976 length:267 start_codon:yes stop_codon:yes gene_type:complete
MSRKSIEIAGPDYHEEITVAFKKQKDGFYKKIVSTARRDRKTNIVKELGDEELDSLYEVVESDDYDERISFYDFDGAERFLKLKLVSE